jgi:YidC/Oxa1 family membrane protein insertase
LLDWLYTAISWVMARWHSLWAMLFGDPEVGTGLSGLSWALSIVFLVVTIRLILFPLFVKQIKSQRAMQELQPEMQKLRKQYGADRQGMAQAQQQLFKERGVNPLAGCLPILPQIPVFLALFHVLRRLSPDAQGLYSWSTELTQEAAQAPFFGAPISSSFNMSGDKEQAILEIATYTNIRIVAFILIVIMCFTTFFTQKQIMRRSGPVEGQAAMVQKLLLYGMPLSLFVSGFFFPIGVLLYWFTNNLWTLGQQFFILRKMPPPGSPAAKSKTEAEKPAIDPKTLAPKPGAKPVRTKGGRPVPPATGTAATGGATGSTAAGSTPPADGPSSAGGPSGANGKAPGSGGGQNSGGRPKSSSGRPAQGPKGKRKRR